jgi:hypothetical protein
VHEVGQADGATRRCESLPANTPTAPCTSTCPIHIALLCIMVRSKEEDDDEHCKLRVVYSDSARRTITHRGACYAGEQ